MNEKTYQPQSVPVDPVTGKPEVEVIGKAGWTAGQGVTFIPEGTAGYYAGAVKGDEDYALVRDDLTGEWVRVLFSEIRQEV